MKLISMILFLLVVVATAYGDPTGVKITGMPTAGTLTGVELVPIVQSGATKGASIESIWNYILFKDGSGSSLDADKLDGQHGVYYQPASTAITTSNIGSQSVNYANSCGSATLAATATNANALGGLSAAYYQMASTAITTSNVGSQHTAYSDTCGNANTATTAITAANATNATTLGGHVPTVQVFSIVPSTATATWSRTFSVDGAYVNLISGTVNLINGTNDNIGLKVMIDNTVIYDFYQLVNYQVAISPTFYYAVGPGNHTISMSLYGVNSSWLGKSPATSPASGYVSILSF